MMIIDHHNDPKATLLYVRLCVSRVASTREVQGAHGCRAHPTGYDDDNDSDDDDGDVSDDDNVSDDDDVSDEDNIFVQIGEYICPNCKMLIEI